jgi:hypothetical protein
MPGLFHFLKVVATISSKCIAYTVRFPLVSWPRPGPVQMDTRKNPSHLRP